MNLGGIPPVLSLIQKMTGGLYENYFSEQGNNQLCRIHA